jgi:ferrous iron transport protein A
MQEDRITAWAHEVNEISLDKLLPGETGVVQRIDYTKAKVQHRLMEMGVVRGTQVQLIRFAPMGDPLEVRVRGYRLSLRRSEAQVVMVSKEVT